MDWIEGYEKATSIFGGWPSFHDAEVLGLGYETTEKGFDVRASIHVWESESELNAKGQFVHRHSSRATLLFVDCIEEDLGGFNGQNVLGGLGLERAEDGTIRATFEPLTGFGGTVVCRAVALVDVRPWPALA